MSFNISIELKERVRYLCELKNNHKKLINFGFAHKDNGEIEYYDLIFEDAKISGVINKNDVPICPPVMPVITIPKAIPSFSLLERETNND